ncbi:flagellar hook-length control protein FliK [Dyella jejuensis]|uniref:Flagellar hook-length control protein FliK n=1 Tax=Dyella jejuensis TaxID=1432009 RepID=A0ABW8JJW8_9GAMM
MNLSFARTGALPVAVRQDSAKPAMAPPSADAPTWQDMHAFLLGERLGDTSPETPAPAAGAQEEQAIGREWEQADACTPNDASVIFPVTPADIPFTTAAAQPSGPMLDLPGGNEGDACERVAEPGNVDPQVQAKAATPQQLALADDRHLSLASFAPASMAPAFAETSMARPNADGAVRAVLSRAVSPTRDGTERTASLPSTVNVRAAAEPLPLASFTAFPTVSESAAAKAHAPPATMAPEQKLLGALGERISMQAAQGTQQAVIRLDPHLSGSVRIELRHEAGALHVHISASRAEVAQQLQAIGDGLRQELSNRQFNDVTVQIHHGRNAEHGGRGGQPQPDHDREAPHRQAPGRAWATDSSDEAFDMAWKRVAETRGYRT